MVTSCLCINGRKEGIDVISPFYKNIESFRYVQLEALMNTSLLYFSDYNNQPVRCPFHKV